MRQNDVDPCSIRVSQTMKWNSVPGGLLGRELYVVEGVIRGFLGRLEMDRNVWGCITREGN